MPTRGFFITIEGGEGVGKSTNLAYLATVFATMGLDVVTTREPGGTPLGEEIRQLLLRARPEPVVPMAELLLIFAARAQHISEVIQPALDNGKWVLCDRFTDATYAYQCAGRGVSVESVQRLEAEVQRGLRPDFTLLFDMPVSAGLARARNRSTTDRFEQESNDFFDRVRSEYLELASSAPERYRVVDVGGSLEQVQRDLHVIAQELLSHWQQSR